MDIKLITVFLVVVVQISKQKPNCDSPTIVLDFVDSDGLNDQVVVYQNNSLSKQFINYHDDFSCANEQIFTYNQTEEQYQTNMMYNISFHNFSGYFSVNLASVYKKIDPQPVSTKCRDQCLIEVSNNCQSDTDSDMILVTVQFSRNSTIKFVYNVICDQDKLSNPIQWGKIILSVVSSAIIFISARFQQAKAYRNIGHYINHITIIAYSSMILLSSILIIVDVPGTTGTISYICLTVSVILGVLGVMVCLGQFMYWLNIQCFRYGVQKWVFRIRVMDGIGLGIGIGLICAWFFTDTNWIISDVIFCFIFFATIKLIKFGSLKIAVITFSFIMTIDILFIVLAWVINRIYYNNAMLSIFNNPLFLVSPSISHYPNRRCSWYFLFSMAYPAILGCYLYRFDCSRSSKVYIIIFFVCYIFTLIIWVVINIVTIFTLPYDLIVIPFTIIVVVLYANRRGQINQIWNGQFYDQVHRNHTQKQEQLRQNIKSQKSPSSVSYTRSMFNGLKFDDTSQIVSEGSRRSDLTQVIYGKYILKPEQQLMEIQKRRNESRDYEDSI